jgi:prevent-host-death family protein
VLRRVVSGEVVTITVKGKPVARLTAAGPGSRRWQSGAEVAQRLRRVQADPELRHELTVLGETTDDLGPIR